MHIWENAKIFFQIWIQHPAMESDGVYGQQGVQENKIDEI
jgi:hypothetical protein